MPFADGRMFDAAARLLRLLPAESAHEVTLSLTGMASAFLPPPPAGDLRLAVNVLGLDFSNPIGLAAGFDKNAALPAAMSKFGFGFVECGTITPRPQAGNPRPRLFRLAKDAAVINRMGFNNDGMARAAENLRNRGKAITGINIGANKDSADRVADYALCFDRLAGLGDYVTANVSSPNTPGLRGLQNRDELERLLGALTEARQKKNARIPILLKIAPDLDATALDDIAAVVLASGIEGMIVTNTTIARPALSSRHAGEQGGLSGRPLFAPSTEILRQMRQRVGTRIVLVGVGGVSSGADAYAKIRAGASLVQLYTALVYEGPGLVARIKRELLALLAQEGFSSVAAAVGADAR